MFVLLGFTSTSFGQPATDEESSSPSLAAYYDLLADRRLLAAETGSVRRLRDLVRAGEQQILSGHYDAAALDLFEVVESPRFADFSELDEFKSAEFMLARALAKLGARQTAARYLEQIIERGPEDPYFGPAYRKYVDVALAGGTASPAIDQLQDALPTEELPDDAANELRYLQGRERYDAGDGSAAEEHFAAVTGRSRFFASAQYLRGVVAARSGDLEGAEERFCSVATTEDQNRLTFFVDDRYFQVKDLAHLALGRVAHEGRRGDDAFYYYFQVPQDSREVTAALFEAAYAMYEAEDYDTAVDLLDQLDARFPRSAFADEAKLLRGYIHLGRCEFEKANKLFRGFARAFGPVRSEVSDIVKSPARQARLYEELLRAGHDAPSGGDPSLGAEVERAAADEEGDTTRALLLSMLEVDPTFYRLHANVKILDAEAARAGRLPSELAQVGVRLAGRERPRPAAEEPTSDWEVAGELQRGVEDARATLMRLTEQLDVMRREGVKRSQLRPLERTVADVGNRLARLERELAGRLHAFAEVEETDEPGQTINALLRRDTSAARRLPARIAATRARLIHAANKAALRAVKTLDRRLGANLRRARIGRIDAVMGSKRRIEIQIESLAAGRFPPELQDPLQIQGLLRDDEEYWPFEGERWEDEFDETDPVRATP